MKKRVFIIASFWMMAVPQLLQAATANDDVVKVEINKGTLVKLDRPASSVVISDPNTADVQVVSPKLILVRGKKIGETSLYAIDAQDNLIVDSVVEVSHNLSGLQREIKRAAPDADVEFKTVDGGMVINGFANNTAESENIRNIASTYIGGTDKLVNMVKTNGSDQIMLKVKIVEMARTDLKKMGLNLQAQGFSGVNALQVLQGNDVLFHTPTAGTDAYSAWRSIMDRGGSPDTQILLRHANLAGVVDALETQGLATTLAEPTLTTTSGQAASFLAGGQFPIPVVQSSTGGAPVVSIQYQPFGVSLNFTPIMMNKDRISLTVAPEVSSLDFSNPIQVSGITYPILLDRKASAVVELGSGDSFMLAGLMQNDGNNSISKFPGLGDLPVLGALFRSTQFQNNQTELVILVTPYVVHPVAAGGQLQTPLDGYKPPSDLQILMNGQLYRQHSPEGDKEDAKDDAPASPDTAAPAEKKTQSLPTLHGEGGFIMD